jgi:Ricin-type beta-trefoil lectin domain-like
MAKTIPAILVTCVLFAASAVADDAKDAKYVKLVHADTSKVLAVAGNSEDAGAKTVLAKDDGSKAQQWQLVKDGDHLKIVNRKTGKVLDVEEASADEGASIIQWDDKDEGTENQRWSWEGKDKDRRLKSKSSSLVLDIGDNDMIVQKKPDDKAKSQLWKVVDVKD